MLSAASLICLSLVLETAYVRQASNPERDMCWVLTNRWWANRRDMETFKTRVRKNIMTKELKAMIHFVTQFDNEHSKHGRVVDAYPCFRTVRGTPGAFINGGHEFGRWCE